MTKSEMLQRELEALRDKMGTIHADHVVSWARANKKSALHTKFEWDDGKAGDQYRLMQARQLITLHVVTEGGDPKVVSLRFDRARGGGYRDLKMVARIPKLRDMLLADALADLERAQERYKHVRALAGVWREVKRVRQQINAARLKSAA